MKHIKWLITMTGVFVVGFVSEGALTNIYYVNANNGSPLPPYATWDDAATSIQAAVNQAQVDLNPGTVECLVLVTNGTYNLTSQIVIGRPITVRSVEGAANTIVNGGYPTYTNRCFLITNNATLSGFTIMNGCAGATGSTPATTNFGGGVYAVNCDALISDCTIRFNNAMSYSGKAGYGGGVALGNGRTELRDCTIETNVAIYVAASYGGGLYLHNWTGLVANCSIVSNVAYNGNAGGINAAATAGGMISNCTLLGNSSRFGSAAILEGGVTMLDCAITSNTTASSKGGVWVVSANAIVRGCLIRDNYAGQAGGVGVYAAAGLVENCRILFNRGGPGYSGGGVFVGGGTVRNCLIAGNQVTGTGLGGGVYKDTNAGYLINCTVAQNQSDSNGVAGIFSAVTTRPETFRNLVVYDNQSTNGDATCIASSYVSWRDNFAYCTAPELTDGVNSNSTANPSFTTSGSGYGASASLGVYTLQAGSPCIDTGTNQVWMDTARDLAGNIRRSPTIGTVDRGCYEVIAAQALDCSFIASSVTTGAAPLVVVFSATVSGDMTGAAYRWIYGDGTTNDWTLGNAVSSNIYWANGTACTVILNVSNAAGEFASSTNLNYVRAYPVTVYVATSGAHVTPFDTWAKAATDIQSALDVAGDGYTTEAIVSNGLYEVTENIVLDKGLTLRSVTTNWADVIVKSGFPLSTNRCFMITAAGAILDGFTVSNGGTAAFNNPTNYGAGINMSAGTVRHCLVISNTAPSTYAGGIHMGGGRVEDSLIMENSAGQDGGGIYLANASAVASNCWIAGNRGNSGGGLRLSLGLLVDSVVSNNSSVNFGGGIYAQASGMASNCTIVENKGGAGGGVRMSGTAGTYVNCRILGNQATTGNGGGVWVDPVNGSGGTIRNCLIAGNTAKGYGGGVWAGHSASFENCTVVGNLAATNGGMMFGAGSTMATGLNCVVYDNQSASNAPLSQADLLITATNSLGTVVTNIAYSCSPYLVSGEQGNVSADPMFAKKGENHGLTLVLGDYRLKKGSPCIDTATNLSWMNTAVDLVGTNRVQGPGPNMGAYEATVPVIGTTLMIN